MIVIIIAAGKGTRMKSDRPKVLQLLHGKPIIKYVNDMAQKIKPDKIYVVVGFQKEKVKKVLKSENVEFVDQNEQMGTGHAVMKVKPYIRDCDDEILVLPGDVPFLLHSTINEIINSHRLHNSAITILTGEKDNPEGYGRVLRNNNNTIQKIVEEKDCSESEKNIKEVNAGVYCFNKNFLLESLEKIDKNNAQKEYYLTDLIKVAVDTKLSVTAVKVKDSNEIYGINTKEELIEAEKYFS